MITGFYKKKYYKVKFIRRRYSFYRKSKLAFVNDHGIPVMTIPIKNRKSLFRNFYFSKLWIMQVFGWLVLKINILIPRMKLGFKKYKNFKNFKYHGSGYFFNLQKNFKSFNFKYRKDFNKYIYKKKYEIIKNFFFFNYYLK